MPRVTEVKTNFTSGELDPEAYGRTDTDRYHNGAELLENVRPMILGGVRGRDGSIYVASAKFPNKLGRLVSFIFSTTEAYILEFGDLYIRFYKNNAQLGAPYEVATIITEAMLREFDFVQGADTMFLMHQGIPTHRLRRFGDTNWALDAIPFEVLPFDEIGHSFSATLTLSAATVGVGRTATASSGIFLNGDVGREIVYQGGTLKITGFTSATVVTGDITSAFLSVNVPADVWTLAGSPREAITPSAKDPLETVITLTATALNIWRSSDVGKFVRVNGGLVQITIFTSATVVSGKIKQLLTAVVAAPADSWSLEASVWSVQNGFPGTGTLYQQRLILAGTPAYPQTVWGSVIGTYLDYMLGSLDSDAFAYTISSDQINPIVRMASAKTLFALTYGGEFSIKGGVEKPITPTNVQVEQECAYGCSNVRPVRAGKEVLFVDRAGLRLRALTYDASDEDYDAEDLTLLASHITRPGIVDMSYQQSTEPVVWCPRSDGVLPSLSFARKQEVVAWARQISDGAVESVATIPIAGGEQTWLYMRRTINGAAVRYIERFDPICKVDSAIVTTVAAPGQDVWAVAHLAGKSVDVLGDGAYLGRIPVVAGNVTLPRKALSVQIGLPYTKRVKLLTPELQTGFGSAQGNAMSTHEVSVLFHETYHCKINGKEMPFREFGANLLDQPPQSVSGLKRLENLGWERGSSDIEFTSDLPFDFHVLAVIRQFTMNAG